MRTTLEEFGKVTGRHDEKVDGEIVLTPEFRHRSLRERAEEYSGRLNLSVEMEWGEPSGREIW